MEQAQEQEEAAVPASPAPDELTRRSVAMLLAQSRAGAATALLAGALLGVVLVPAAGWGLYLLWYGTFAACMLGRQPYFRRLVERAGPTPAILYRIALLAALTGWFAPATVLLFAPFLSLADAGVLTIIAVGWVALAVAVLAVQPRVYAGYVAGCFAAIFGGWCLQAEGRELAVIGFALVLGGRMLVKLAHTLQGHLAETVAASEENARLVGQLREALVQQEEARRARSRFLGAASHDLRQPVQALLFLADVFAKSRDEGRRDEMARHIVRTSESIDTMFRHLVDFAQIDAGNMQAALQPVHLGRLVQAAVSGYAAKCAAKGIAFRLDLQADGTVMADPVLLERLLRNFLDNAWKYSLRGEIQVAVRQRADALEVSVQDQGVGMDEDDLAQVWKAFHRGRSASRAESEGIGLGLAICRHMAELMHCQLDLQSTVGVGTRVSIRVPQPRAGAEAPNRPQEETLHGLEGRLVAVVEDDRLAREALASWLQEAGATVVVATGQAELLAALEQGGRAPDFLVADFRLAQGGNGVEAIQAVRRRWGAVPAVVVSGEPDLDQQVLGVPALQKPVTPQRLMAVVDALLLRQPAEAAHG